MGVPLHTHPPIIFVYLFLAYCFIVEEINFMGLGRAREKWVRAVPLGHEVVEGGLELLGAI